MITLWSLYNTVDKIQIDDLKTEQVRIVLLSIPTARMKDWVICKKGELRWQSLLQVPEFYEDVVELKGEGPLSKEDLTPPQKERKSPSPAPPSRRPLFEDLDLESEETLSVMGAESFSVSERRSARRYNKKLKFEIIKGGKSFSTETVDISMSGISLEDDLPDWASRQFGAVLSLNEHRLKVTVAKVSEGENKLKIIDADYWEILRSWVSGW